MIQMMKTIICVIFFGWTSAINACNLKLKLAKIAITNLLLRMWSKVKTKTFYIYV